MSSLPTPQSAGAAESFARNLLSIAAEVEAAESEIKQAIVTAARAGDCSVVVDIMTAWADRPPADVVLSLPQITARLTHSAPAGHNNLDSCSRSEVSHDPRAAAVDGNRPPAGG